MDSKEIEQTIDAYLAQHHHRYKENSQLLGEVSEAFTKLAIGLIHEHDLPENVERALVELSVGYKTTYEAFQDFTYHSELLVDSLRRALSPEDKSQIATCPPPLKLEDVSVYQFLKAKMKQAFRSKRLME